MDAIKTDFMAGKESISAEAKRLFAEIEFGDLKKSDFVSRMLDGVIASANDVHEMVKHLEAVWRGKAAPTMAELERAKSIVLPSPKRSPAQERVEKFFQKKGIVPAYEPKYPATKALQKKMQTSKTK